MHERLRKEEMLEQLLQDVTAQLKSKQVEVDELTERMSLSKQTADSWEHDRNELARARTTVPCPALPRPRACKLIHAQAHVRKHVHAYAAMDRWMN